MAGRPHRRLSKEIPPDLSDLLKKHSESVDLFITQFNTSELRMRELGSGLHKIAVHLARMHKRTDSRRKYGMRALLAGMGIAFLCYITGMLDIPLSGGLTLGATFAAFGGALVISANGAKILQHNESGKKMKARGQESMKITEPLKSCLEQIKETRKKLEETAAEAQVDRSLSAIQDLQELLQIMAKLSDDMKLVSFVTVNMFVITEEILPLLMRLFQLSATPKEDEKLRQIIIQSADQCQKAVDELASVKNELRKI